jgi:hypothetical protein
MLKMKANSFADLVKMAVTLPLAAQTADAIRYIDISILETSTNPNSHQVSDFLCLDLSIQKLPNNLHMRLKMLRDGHRRELSSPGERHRQQELIRQMGPNNRLRRQITPRRIHCTLRHTLRRHSLLAEPGEHFGDVLVLDRQRQCVARSELPRQATNMQILAGPIEHLEFFVGRAVRAPALARHGELEA